jgi:hypothetical protein
MMNLEQVSAQAMKNMVKISAIEEAIKSVVRRIDDNDGVISVIHKLAGSIEVLAQQVASLTRSVEKQGERIGNLESKPGKRWEAVAAQVAALCVAAVFGGVLSRLI